MALGEYRGPSRFKPLSRYLAARMRRDALERSWLVFMAEQTRLAPQGKAYAKPWHELIGAGEGKRVDGRTGDEIAASVISSIGLEVET